MLMRKESAMKILFSGISSKEKRCVLPSCKILNSFHQDDRNKVKKKCLKTSLNIPIREISIQE